MPASRKTDDSDDPEKVPFGTRLKNAFLKPADPDAPSETPEPKTVEELEAVVKSADDKERLVGLLAAPLAAIIGILVISALIANDPSALLKNGQVNPKHVNPSTYRDLALVLVGMAVLMLAAAWFRKRLYLGVLLALYGLAVFNLHYWGFGIPFLLAGSWLLVRAYRIQRDLKEATAESAADRRGAGSGGPKQSKRYTPPTSPPKRSSPPEPENGKKAS